MIRISLFFALSGLLLGASARNLPTRTHVVRKVEVAAAPAVGPITPLVSDFSKNNVSAKWAEGHPKIWGEELKKFEIPIPASANYYGFAGALTEDGKYLILANITATQFINPDTGAIISTTKKPDYGSPKIAVIGLPGGGYSVFQSFSSMTTEQRFSQDGVAVGEEIIRPGSFSSFDGPQFSSDKRRLITVNGQVVQVFDLNDPDSIISLAGHIQGVMSAQFSPDGKYISTTSWDEYTRVWDANGKLVKKLGPSGTQNWFTNFSPDSKTLLYSVGSGVEGSRIDRVPTSDFSATPQKTILSGWARSIAWSPDGQFFAYSTGASQVIVIKASDGSVVQQWQSTLRYNEPGKVSWLEGGKKLAFQFNKGLEVYDFETNLKYRWAPDELDQYNVDLSSYYAFKSKGWIITADADQTVRFWAYPV